MDQSTLLDIHKHTDQASVQKTRLGASQAYGQLSNCEVMELWRGENGWTVSDRERKVRTLTSGIMDRIETSRLLVDGY